jgi:glyoxylase-like metal-dependent hydrolase (beta-lactamase superfamily II)
LLNTLESADLKRLPDLMLQDVPHNLVEFTRNGVPVRVYLNSETHLPTAVEWVNAYPYGIFWSIWGDVTTRVYYSLWWLQEGIHYPLQIDVFRNGLPDRTATITKLEFNPTAPSDAFAISQASRDAFAARAKMTADDRPLGSRPAQEPAPGIVIIPGPWNTTIVRQQDGIVVLEAPISSGYSVKLIAEAERRFPGVPIKAVITTSDAWPHIGGVREYVARGIPVYAVPRTRPLLERFLNAPRTRFPDALSKSPRKAELRLVSEKLVIGAGPNRMEIYPVRGETSERQMMVYFPEHKLLYGSDVFQKLSDGKYFYDQTISEVVAAAEREHLAVETFFMMHMGLTPWQDALKELQAAQ